MLVPALLGVKSVSAELTIVLEHLHLFGATVVSVLAYGSEAWLLDGNMMASLRGWCAKCMVRLIQLAEGTRMNIMCGSVVPCSR